jgi:fructose/tagatose bisphosphate aldolase
VTATRGRATARRGNALPRAVVVHHLDHALAALQAAERAGAGVLLLSPEGFAGYGGAGLFAAIVADASRQHPSVPVLAMLDCAESPGLALSAFRIGIRAVRLGARPSARRRVAAIAQKLGATVRAERPPALDLLDVSDIETACRVWFADAATPASARRAIEK